MFKHFFLPHPQTHQRAKLISTQALLIYIAIFVTLQVSLGLFSKIRPGVLGISSNVNQQELIRLTNVERQKLGLPTLREDSKLDMAALAKGQNMFAENYWAHYSPSGKDPWGFINGAGYKFTYAGENLARNFYNSPEVVAAWMASPTHKENIVNPHYQDVGMAVLEGTLNGQKTILVVQEFGSATEYTAQTTPSSTPQIASEQTQTPPFQQLPAQTAVLSEKLTDPYLLMRSAGMVIIFLVGSLLLIDFYILRRRAVIRLSSTHLPHLALLSLTAATLLNSSPGAI